MNVLWGFPAFGLSFLAQSQRFWIVKIYTSNPETGQRYLHHSRTKGLRYDEIVSKMGVDLSICLGWMKS